MSLIPAMYDCCLYRQCNMLRVLPKIRHKFIKSSGVQTIEVPLYSLRDNTLITIMHITQTQLYRQHNITSTKSYIDIVSLYGH